MTLPQCLSLVLATSLCSLAAPSFTRDVQPILQKHCQGCHQPASKSAGLDLTSYNTLKAGGRAGSPLAIAGNPDSTLLIQYVTGAKQPRMPIGAPALSPDQITLLRDWITAGVIDDSPTATGSTSTELPVYVQPSVITALAFSPDGKLLAVSGNREILLHNSDGRGSEIRLPGQAERILSLSFTKDGSTLVAGGGTPAKSGEIQIWDLATRKLRQATKVTDDTVFGTSISPDGKLIAAGGADNTVRILDAATGKELHKIGNHENWVLATVFDAQGKRLISVGRDRAAKLIDAASGAFLENVNLLRGELAAIARHPSKPLVVIGGEDRYPYIYMLDRPKNMRIADDTTLVRKIDRQNGPITALAWSPDGKWIAVAGAAPEVNVYDSETGVLVSSCKGHSAGIYSITFSPDSRTLASGGFDGFVRLYSAANGKLDRSFVPVPLSKASSPTSSTSERPE